MHPRFLCAAVLLSLAGCAPAAAPPAVDPSPVPAEPPTRLEPRAWTPQSPAAEIAGWLAAGCARAVEGKQPCLERALVALLDHVGLARTHEALDTLAARDSEVFSNAHPLAHGLGISAYRSPETAAATFAACPATQMSGCQHGVIQGYFLDAARRGAPIGRAEVDGLCAPHWASVFVFFQCAHGMGHGLMAFHGNHLPSALAACEQASDETLRESCYGGAFMENVVNATHPHHSAGGHEETQGDDGHGAHGGHGDGHAMHHEPWKALDPADPHYPCNAVDARYQDACYALQPSAVMFFNGGDVAATAGVCDAAPAALRATCFVSLGREITAYAIQDHARTIEMCGRVGGAGGGRGVEWCTRGAAGTLISQSADPREGMRFCRALADAERKGECYGIVGGFVAQLVQGTQARASRCAAAEPGYDVACRRGAGIEPSARPEE